MACRCKGFWQFWRMSKSRSQKATPPAWPVPPMITGDWRDLDAETTEAFRIRLIEAQSRPRVIAHSGPLQAFRLFPLTCYPGFLSVDLLVGGEAGPRALWFLYGPQGPFPITGESALLHDLNDRGLLALNDEAAATEYLRLFCSAVQGEEGPFYIVESVQRYADLTGYEINLPDPLFSLLKPLSAQATLDGWLIRGQVLYGDQLFSTQFSLSRGGLVEMIEDEMLGGPKFGPVFTVDGPLRAPKAAANAKGGR